MRAVDIIARKRDGFPLTKEEIEFFVKGSVEGSIPDYQISAWLMAVYLKGMTIRETVDLTLAMAFSGEVLDLKEVAPLTVDKHSTGGVGDKTTLVIAPIVASLGLPIAKMSGRGLSFSGGTIDKLESIRGYRVDLSVEEFKRQVSEHGIVVSGQTAQLAPADAKFYALRDVTATVPSLPLIASSIMSKKIAAGTDVLVLDVKVGKGAFMKTLEDAKNLARLMVDIGRDVGKRVSAVIADMNQPLGLAVGNALEVKEAIDTLQGRGPQDFVEHCIVVAAEIVRLAGKARDSRQARSMVEKALKEGKAWEKFVEWIEAQGGDRAVVEDPSLLPQARYQEPLLSPRSGYISELNAMEVGMAAVILGAGREKKGEPIDHSVGIVLHKKIGNYVEKNEPLLTIYANDLSRLEEARKRLLGAFSWSEMEPSPPPLIYEVIR
ncbi:MAG: pyrimidine-nucleoside phosphorylase [Chloroflexi bacterium]|nr:MAG: pyrimidine-nucleoside phosphorylase [Chloroflexota bacterium]HDN80465.1 pyrimidine-nucleoside phosphorylase [Chloroflexota bacterium]